MTNFIDDVDFESLDLLGVGIGPFNMSLAALLSTQKDINAKFFDGRANFVWHAGQLMPDAEIQVSFLKDLVTLVDPTNPYSFLAFLRGQKRLYRFISGNFNHVLRMEFSQYFNWVSKQLPNLFFNESIQEIKFKKSCFLVQTSKRVLRSKNLALGSGLSPNIPDSALPHLSDSVYHIKDFLRRGNNWQGKRIAIIGGGQSGAEALQAILSDSSQLPESISWISRRNHFAPMDESVFANELFTPNFSSFFFQQSKERKAQLVKEQTLASDGISQSLLQNIYQRLYFLECIEQRPQIVNFLNSHTLVDMTDANGAHQLILSDEANQQLRIVEADIVILATGFRWQFPAYLNGLKEQINLDQEGNFIVNEDFSIDWAGQCENKIFVLNGARHSHGVADPNLSLMAWRSATIINSLSGRTIYDLNGESSAMNWQAAPPQRSSLSLPRNKREGNKIAARII